MRGARNNMLLLITTTCTSVNLRRYILPAHMDCRIYSALQFLMLKSFKSETKLPNEANVLRIDETERQSTNVVLTRTQWWMHVWVHMEETRDSQLHTATCPEFTTVKEEDVSCIMICYCKKESRLQTLTLEDNVGIN